jgi:hypothetical protein
LTSAIAKTNPLPATYAAAKVAIEKCARVDECKDWADKAKALAIYAKQSKDKTLENNAVRIRARAIDRQGALLKLIEAAKGGRPKTGATANPSSRRSAAKAAGLSPAEQKTAIRVNNVPRDQFEAQVESDKPPTVQALAQQGVQPHPLAPGFDRADMDAGRGLWGLIRRAHEESMKVKIAQALCGMTTDEIAVTIERGEALAKWLAATLLALKGVMRDGEKGKSEMESKVGTEDNYIPPAPHY